MTKKSIKKLTLKNLCFQCGTCKSICPQNAIIMKRLNNKGLIYPKIDESKCIDCGLCLKVCPINNLDYNEKHLPKESDFIGIYNSANKDRIKYTASGGAVTEIINYLFNEKKINKAIVTGMDKEKPTNGKVYVIENNKKLNEVSGSVYQPVAVNEALSTINVNDKVAFVGLPCHMRGLELFLNLKPKLKECFVLKLGLICTIGRSKHGTTITLKKSLKLKRFDDIKNIIYRYGNHPGDTIVNFKNKTKKSIEHINFLQNTDYIFMPKGCLFCTDLFNDKADITVGDPWGVVKEKKAMVIARNKSGINILNEMVNKDILNFNKELKVEECIKTQYHCVTYKIYNYGKRISAYKNMGVAVPNIKNLSIEENSLKENIGFNLLLLNSIFFNTYIGLKIVEILPSKILFKYRNKVSSINIMRKRG